MTERDSPDPPDTESDEELQEPVVAPDVLEGLDEEFQKGATDEDYEQRS